MIFLETFNKSQLEDLIHSDRFLDFSFLPITVHRAASHINNPNLDAGATTLILAFDDGKLAGYIGIMADRMLHRGQKISVGWLSTLFVHPDFRGKKIAQQLLNKACDEYQGKILITEFTPEAESMYVKSGMFVYQHPLEGMSYHFLSNTQKILPSKNKKWTQLLPFLRLGDAAVNVFAKSLYQLKSFSGNNFVTQTAIDAEIAEFIQKHKKQNNFYWDINKLKWITKYPWVLEGNNPEQRPYQFSDFDKKFEYVFIKTYENEIMKTLLLLSVRNANAKLQYVIGENEPQLSAAILYRFAVENKIANFICFDEGINEHFKKYTVLFRKQRTRKFLMHKNLRELLGEDFVFDISAGDSDAIFT